MVVSKLAERITETGKNADLLKAVTAKVEPLVTTYVYVEQILAKLATATPEAFPIYTRWYPGDLPSDVLKYIIKNDRIRNVLIRIALVILGDDARAEKWTAHLVVSAAYFLYLFQIMGFMIVPVEGVLGLSRGLNSMIATTNDVNKMLSGAVPEEGKIEYNVDSGSEKAAQ